MSKTFKCAGVSTRNGVIKARFASDMTRVKVLAKTGSKDIDLIELKHPMTKEDAIAFLLSINFDNGNAEVRAALEAALEKRQPRAAKSKDAPKKEAKKPKKDKVPSLEKIAARKPAKPATTMTREQVESKLADMEEAPF